MELRHLRYVIAVAEELHFGKAAVRLGMSQPPLSQQIRQLEEELRVKLFHRTKRQVQLSEAGVRFVQEARQILEQVNHAARLAWRVNNGEIGYLIVGTVTSEKRILIDALSVFHARHPDVHVELRSLSTPAQIQALREERIQVGFVIQPAEEASLTLETVASEPLIVALPARHPLASRKRVSLATLSSEGSILFPRTLSPGYYDQIVSFCRNAGFSLGVHEMDNFYSALALVESGYGVSLLPASIGKVENKGLVFREVEESMPPVECAIAYKPDVKSSVVRAFVSVVREVSAECDLHKQVLSRA